MFIKIPEILQEKDMNNYILEGLRPKNKEVRARKNKDLILKDTGHTLTYLKIATAQKVDPREIISQETADTRFPIIEAKYYLSSTHTEVVEK